VYLSWFPARRVLEQVSPACTICYANAEPMDTSPEPTAPFVTMKVNSS
jgi:hypothetical protein